MKKAKSYCGLLFGVGVALVIVGIMYIVVFNISFYDQGVIRLHLFFSFGSLLIFLSYVISKIVENIEVEMNEIRDRTFNLDIKINEQKRR